MRHSCRRLLEAANPPARSVSKNTNQHFFERTHFRSARTLEWLHCTLQDNSIRAVRPYHRRLPTESWSRERLDQM